LLLLVYVRLAAVILFSSGSVRTEARRMRLLALWRWFWRYPTLQPANFGRVYAAYGGVFIVLSILWGWRIDKIVPDRFDLIGGAIALAGVLIIIYWPRNL